jgi:hypothetical protein
MKPTGTIQITTYTENIREKNKINPLKRLQEMGFKKKLE